MKRKGKIQKVEKKLTWKCRKDNNRLVMKKKNPDRTKKSKGENERASTRGK